MPCPLTVRIRQKKTQYDYYDWFEIFRIFMNRMKTVIKLTFAHVKGVFKFMAKLILGTFGQACPVSTYMAESEKAKKHYQAYEANRNVHKALWAQVHNCRIIEAIITVWLTTTSPTSSYGILESCLQQHYCHQHHHQHHYCRKKIITAIITELTKTETSSANQDLRKAPSMTASWPPTIKFPELNELLNALILLAWFRLTKNWT